MPISEGKRAPSFTLEDASGNQVRLGDFSGHNVILYFYPKDETPGCTKEACAFRDLFQEISANDAVILGVSPDNQTSHAKFRDNHKLPFILLSDPDKKVMIKYDAFGEKTSYGRKTKGVIRSTVWIGPDGTVRKHWRPVARAEDHPAQVLAALQGGATSQPRSEA